MQKAKAYGKLKGIAGAACAVVLCAVMAFVSVPGSASASSDDSLSAESDEEEEDEGSIYLSFPAFIQRLLARIFPSVVVEDTETSALNATETLSITDRAAEEINLEYTIIETYEDGLDVVEAIGDTSTVTAIGSFFISDELLESIQTEVDSLGSTASFLLLDLETGVGLAYNIDASHYSASTIKANSMCAICYYYPEALTDYYSDIEATLVGSSNSAYDTVFHSYDVNIYNQWRERARLNNQQYGQSYTYYSTREFAQLWLVNWDYLTSEGDAPETLRTWMSDSAHSSYAAVLGTLDGYTVCSKAGWEYGSLSASSEGGYIVSPGGTYLLCVMTDTNGDPDKVLADLVALLDEAYQTNAETWRKLIVSGQVTISSSSDAEDDSSDTSGD